MLSLIPRLPVGHIRSRSLAKAKTAQASSVLAGESSALGPDAFATFTGNGFTTEANHPNTTNAVTILEDGKEAGGANTLGYSGKGCYDPTGRKVLWMGCGYSTGTYQNAGAGNYIFNTRPIYDEASNSWSVDRAFQASDDTNAAAIGHQYDGNCIDVSGRRLIKRNFWTDFYVYNIDTDTMGARLAGPEFQSATLWNGATEYIPSGPYAGLWLFTLSSSNQMYLWRWNGSTWSGLKNEDAFGNVGETNGAVMSYNPRAFSGAGGVLLACGSGQWTIRCDDLTMTSVSLPSHGDRLSINAASDGGGTGYNSGFCRDPRGPGWLHFHNRLGYVHRYDGSSWSQQTSLPSMLSAGDARQFIVVPIDDYGVVWCISWGAETRSMNAALYKPVAP